MDVLAAMIFGIIIVKAVEDKGYKEDKLKYATARNASLIAGAGLLIIYCGLTYLGATTSEIFNMNINRSELIVNITYGLLGNAGTIVLGIVVTLACLTTAIALITSTADYFHSISNGKLSYKLVAVITALVSALLAMVGTDMIISIAAPVLSLLYPGAMTLLALSFLREKISNWTLRFSVVGALIGSLLIVLYDLGLPVNFVTSMPLSSFGLGWVIFAVVFGIVGIITGKIKGSKTA
jgi:LIVCS family branched-chain amino acid:cation transporter